jgi:hypothetical protein
VEGFEMHNHGWIAGVLEDLLSYSEQNDLTELVDTLTSALAAAEGFTQKAPGGKAMSSELLALAKPRRPAWTSTIRTDCNTRRRERILAGDRFCMLGECQAKGEFLTVAKRCERLAVCVRLSFKNDIRHHKKTADIGSVLFYADAVAGPPAS